MKEKLLKIIQEAGPADTNEALLNQLICLLSKEGYEYSYTYHRRAALAHKFQTFYVIIFVEPGTDTFDFVNWIETTTD